MKLTEREDYELEGSWTDDEDEEILQEQEFLREEFEEVIE